MVDQKIINQLEIEMDKIIKTYQKDIHKFRTGRASAEVLERIFVDAYGSETPILQVAQISVPEPNQLIVKPYDRSLINATIAAISKSNLNLSPLVDGDLIRINIPKLTEDLRKKMVKDLEKELESYRIRIRNERRNVLNKVKKDFEGSKDLHKEYEDVIQKITDKYIGQLETITKDKEKSIMTI